MHNQGNSSTLNQNSNEKSPIAKKHDFNLFFESQEDSDQEGDKDQQDEHSDQPVIIGIQPKRSIKQILIVPRAQTQYATKKPPRVRAKIDYSHQNQLQSPSKLLVSRRPLQMNDDDLASSINSSDDEGASQLSHPSKDSQSISGRIVLEESFAESVQISHRKQRSYNYSHHRPQSGSLEEGTNAKKNSKSHLKGSLLVLEHAVLSPAPFDQTNNTESLLNWILAKVPQATLFEVHYYRYMLDKTYELWISLDGIQMRLALTAISKGMNVESAKFKVWLQKPVVNMQRYIAKIVSTWDRSSYTLVDRKNLSMGSQVRKVSPAVPSSGSVVAKIGPLDYSDNVQVQQPTENNSYSMPQDSQEMFRGLSTLYPASSWLMAVSSDQNSHSTTECFHDSVLPPSSQIMKLLQTLQIDSMNYESGKSLLLKDSANGDRLLMSRRQSRRYKILVSRIRPIDVLLMVVAHLESK